MDKKRRVAMAMVFLMVFSIIDFSGFTHISASTLDEGTGLKEESAPTLSEGDIEAEEVSMPEIQSQKDDTVSSQELEELSEDDSQDLEELSTGRGSLGVTFDYDDYSSYIYANGNPITLKAGPTDNWKTLIYLDSAPGTPIEIAGVNGNISDGYDLSGYSIYGGSNTESVASTSVTMLGGKVSRVYGGGGYGTVSGNTNVAISGGTILQYVYGGGYCATVEGNTSVTISDTAIIQEDVFGGAFDERAHVTGSSNVTISGGILEKSVYGGGHSTNTVGSTTVTVTGGNISGSVYGGGSYGKVLGTVLVKIGVDACVVGSIEASSAHIGTVSDNSHVEYEVAFYDGLTKLTNPESQWINKTENKKAERPTSNPTSTGKIFRGWKDGAGENYDFINTSVTAATKLFIDWGYTVSYNGNGNNGGTVPVEPNNYLTNEAVVVSGNPGKLTKDGYTFDGWSISQNGKPEKFYTVGTTPMIFYAVWVPKPTYPMTVTNGTGGRNYWEGQTVTVTADSRGGYTFTGWSGSDGVAFKDSKATTTTFLMPANPVTVSANYNTSYHYLIDEKTAEGFPGGKYKKGYATITLKKTSYVYTGSEIRPVPVVYFTYTEYDDTGKQTGKPKKKKLVENVDYKVGTVLGLEKILITGMGDYQGTMTKEFTITPKSIKKAVIDPIEDVKATGADLKTQIDARILVKDGVNTVSRNDYDITYQVNGEIQSTLLGDATNPTLVTVSITGKNNYKDTIKKTQTFTILPQNSNATSVSGFALEVKLPKKGYIYSGKAIKPKITVTGSKGTKVKLNKDYKISYKNNVNAGEKTATIIVSGKNNYFGSKSIAFTIQPQNMSKVKIKTLSKIAYRQTIEDLELTIKDGKSYLKKGVDYTVDFSTSKDLSLGKLKVKKVTLSVNAVEKSNYTGKKEVTCYIIPRSLTNKLTTKIECQSVPFTDTVEKQGATPVPVIHYNGDLLEKGTDFEIVKYINNKKVGTGKVVIKGIGNYTGTRTVKFQIIKPEQQ
ncbi:MAG: InlB B-repeat-containing protein [Lachnospiraceae bacterium]|nr:InlB B-repeat-containing protein [Lachnospiraceae bacterium]